MSATTRHSTMISEVFICRECHSDVEMHVLEGGDIAHTCVNPRCGKTVNVDCPEGLEIRDDLAIELPAPPADHELAAMVDSDPLARSLFDLGVDAALGYLQERMRYRKLASQAIGVAAA